MANYCSAGTVKKAVTWFYTWFYALSESFLSFLSESFFSGPIFLPTFPWHNYIPHLCFSVKQWVFVVHVVHVVHCRENLTRWMNNPVSWAKKGQLELDLVTVMRSSLKEMSWEKKILEEGHRDWECPLELLSEMHKLRWNNWSRATVTGHWF